TTEVIDRLPTHDWYICLLACIKNGFYITNQILTLRRYTGNNVALKMTNSKISNIENRIRGIDTYNKCYRLIENLQFKKKIMYIDIEPFINNNNIRNEYLRNYSLFKAIKNIENIKYYPSIKSYVGDILLLIK